MVVKIREATRADIDTLRNFENELVEHERPIEPTLRQSGIVQYYDIEKLLDSENTLVLIAELDGNPVGCGFGEIKENLKRYGEKYHGYVGFMCVTKQYRRQGIGTLILDRIMDWFKEKKISEVRLRVYEKSEATVKSYKKYGFNNFVLEMRYKLN